MKLSVNGREREVSDGLSVAELLDELGLDPRTIAVERNLQLVPRSEHQITILAADDRLEVVTLVGGG